MSPREIRLEMEAYYWRRDDKYKVESAFFAGLMNMLKGRKGGRVKPRDLYRPAIHASDSVPLKERQRRFERAVKIMGPDTIPVRPRR